MPPMPKPDPIHTYMSDRVFDGKRPLAADAAARAAARARRSLPRKSNVK